MQNELQGKLMKLEMELATIQNKHTQMQRSGDDEISKMKMKIDREQERMCLLFCELVTRIVDYAAFKVNRRIGLANLDIELAKRQKIQSRLFWQILPK